MASNPTSVAATAVGRTSTSAADVHVGPQTKAITIAILAMGGEGGGVLADWVVDLAEHSGYFAQTTSVPGVAQRTGATIYYIELFPAGDKQPVLALMPFPGELDIVIASELMEAARAVDRALVTPDRTTLIASTHRVYSMIEKTAMADGRVSSEALLETCRGAARNFIARDFARVAGASVISAPLFGALAASGCLPFTRPQFEDAIKRGGVGVESSLAAFAAGFSAEEAKPADRVSPKAGPVASRIDQFPPATLDILTAAVNRLTDYQDAAYASEYLDLLANIRAADHAPFELLKETARYLALWMSYEDAIRVADLKTRRERFERVKQESRVAEGQLLAINEFLHPRAAEIADILPAWLGRWLLEMRWAKRSIDSMTHEGRIVRTTSLGGFLQLYFLARLRRWRRISYRFQRESRAIREWLDKIPALAKEDYQLALEVAECPRLIKGYGDTHALGSRNFNAVIGALPGVQKKPGAAAAVKKLREAALADDSGKKLTEALREVNA